MSAVRQIGPGFSADASLYPSRSSYRASSGSFVGIAGDSVVLQRQAGGGGLGGIGVGGLFSDFGCYMSYSFCLFGCAWEWLTSPFPGPIADTLGEKCVLDCQVELYRCLGGLPPGPGIP